MNGIFALNYLSAKLNLRDRGMPMKFHEATWLLLEQHWL